MGTGSKKFIGSPDRSSEVPLDKSSVLGFLNDSAPPETAAAL